MPLDFLLTGGQINDCTQAIALLGQRQAEAVLADKGYDADAIVAHIEAMGARAVIPPKRNRKVQRDYDKELHKARHLIENFFARLKTFRAIATRYDKTARNFLAAVHFAATLIWLI